MKLLWISLLSLVIMGLLWLILSVFSNQQTYQAYDHPVLRFTDPVLALAPSTFQAATEFVQQKGGGALYLTVFMSQDGQFFTLDEKEHQGLKSQLYSYEELKKLSQDIVPLKAWFQLQARFWILNVQTNTLDVDRNLIALIEAEKWQDQVIIRSDTDVIISAMKEKKPLWVFGSSQSDMTQFLTMASAKLEGMPRFNRDVYFTPLEFQGRDMMNASVFAEVRKRKKKLAIGPVHTDQDRERAQAHQPDILILSESYLKEIVLQPE